MSTLYAYLVLVHHIIPIVARQTLSFISLMTACGATKRHLMCFSNFFTILMNSNFKFYTYSFYSPSVSSCVIDPTTHNSSKNNFIFSVSLLLVMIG